MAPVEVWRRSRGCRRLGCALPSPRCVGQDVRDEGGGVRGPVLNGWNDGPARAAIIDFVARVTEEGAGFVPPDERVAVFDNDGTLWCEKPMPIQLDFLIQLLAARGRQDQTLAGTQPWKAAIDGDLGWFGQAMVAYYRGDPTSVKLLLDSGTGLFADRTVEEYAAEVERFFATAVHPTLGIPYTACGFVPMMQLLDFLRAHGFTVYIASGGDRDFMRPIAARLYGEPSEDVIGSALGLEYTSTGPAGPAVQGRDGRTGRRSAEADPDLEPNRSASDSGGGQLQRRRPMLSFTGRPGGPALRLLIRHDDAEREFDDVAGARTRLRSPRRSRGPSSA